MNTYNIYKKRDGQEFKKVSEIYASSFDEAKKIFAHNMTKDNHEKSNNIQWVENLEGVENGFYDFNCSIISWLNDDCDEIDVENSKLEVFCLEEDILNGFDYWNEDVYSWELRDVELEEEDED